MAAEGLGLEITELRLGLPGGGGERNDKKRVFSGGGGGGGCGRKNRNTGEVVGWPPVCTYRKKNTTKMYVKVSMDGAPFLRKIDINGFKEYSDFVMALEKLFDCYGLGEPMKDEGDKCECIPIYEDKDGDWMLVGDVPWEMFTETCKRLRIKKRWDDNNNNGINGLRTENLMKEI